MMLTRHQSRAARPVAARSVAARPAGFSKSLLPKSRRAPSSGFSTGSRTTRDVVARSAAKDEIDFDKFLIILATKWEEADNKAVVVGYSIAAVSAFFITEWFLHLPILDFLLGFPVQLVGLLTLPWLIVRWFVDKQDWYEDVSGVSGYLVGKLPYLEKKKE